MLFLSLLAIAAMAVLPSMAFQIRRDREEEMIHRGVAYSRAIRRFYKKFGRYPTKIEELENTNNLRFLRKRYTDPMNVVDGKEQDFKILHMSDVPIGVMAGMPGATGQQNQGQNLQGVYGTAPQAVQAAAQQAVIAQAAAQQQNTPAGATNASGDDSANPSNVQTGPNPSPLSSSPASPLSGSQQPGGLTGQTFGGGPMLGVASSSKKKTVREFCKKNHYNDWKFVYDPTGDRGGALTTPWCPLAAGQGLGAGFNRNGIGPAVQPNAGQSGQFAQPNPSSLGGPNNVQQNPASNMPPDQ
jgi:hypothetical protein